MRTLKIEQLRGERRQGHCPVDLSRVVQEYCRNKRKATEEQEEALLKKESSM
jgi:hypothetical protein